MKFSVFIVLALALSIDNALAEHENDHRYNIRGYVLDEQEKPIEDLDVRAYDGSSLLASSKTDSAGYYSLHLHLHNADKGKKIRLHAGSSEAELRVTFDTDDLTSIRVHEANFVGGKFIEEGLARFRVPPWVYPLGGFIVIGYILVMLERRRKRKIKRKQLAGSSSGKKRKSKRH